MPTIPSSTLATALARRDIHYGWVVVAVTFVTLLVTAAAMGTPGVLIVPLEHEFGWDEAQISSALALRILLFEFYQSLSQPDGVQLIDGKHSHATLRATRPAGQPVAAFLKGIGQRGIHNLNQLLVAGWSLKRHGTSITQPTADRVQTVLSGFLNQERP